MLLDELGLTRGLLEPLVRQYIAPLCARLPGLAPRAAIDHHKVRPTCTHSLRLRRATAAAACAQAFVVRYSVGADESLAAHYDNAELTLNVNLGLDFDGGELAFPAHADLRAYYHAWREAGHGVLHLGERVHSALPIAAGERENLVVWMRSTEWRQAEGCPMCGRTDQLL